MAERKHINIATALVEKAAFRKELLDTVILASAIKLLHIHSVIRVGDRVDRSVAAFLHCSCKTAARIIDNAKKFPYICEFGEGYIKAHSLTRLYESEGVSRKSKEHGHLQYYGVMVLRLPVLKPEEISVNSIKRQLYMLLLLNAIRKAYRYQRGNNKSVHICCGLGEGNIAQKLYSVGFVGNFTWEQAARIINKSKQQAGNILMQLVRDGWLVKYDSRFSYQGDANYMTREELNGCVVIGSSAFKRIPCAYRFNGKENLHRTGHLIINHSHRTGIPQKEVIIEDGVSRYVSSAPDATNPHVPVSAFYHHYNDMSKYDTL